MKFVLLAQGLKFKQYDFFNQFLLKLIDTHDKVTSFQANQQNAQSDQFNIYNIQQFCEEYVKCLDN